MAQFTKKAIIESFLRLLEQKPLDKITVKDIVLDCDINRGTFYYYFPDVYALVEEIFEADAKRITEEHSEYTSWQEAFLEATQFARESKRRLYHAFNSISREKLEKYLYNIAGHLMYDFVEQQSEGLNASKEDKEFITSFYVCALVGFALSWIGNGMKEDPEIYINKLGTLFDGNIRQALEKSAERNSDKK